MPTVRKPKNALPEADALYVCTSGFATQTRAIPRGTRLRGSDPIVAEHFGFFRPDGTPESEWPSEFDRIVQAAEQPEQTPPRLRLTRDVVLNRGGRVETIKRAPRRSPVTRSSRAPALPSGSR